MPYEPLQMEYTHGKVSNSDLLLKKLIFFIEFVPQLVAPLVYWLDLEDISNR